MEWTKDKPSEHPQEVSVRRMYGSLLLTLFGHGFYMGPTQAKELADDIYSVLRAGGYLVEESRSELHIRIASELIASQAKVTTKDNGNGTYTHTFDFMKGK